jgi:ribosome maturation factor RimP
MNADGIAAAVGEKITGTVEALGYELVAVEYEKRFGEMHLTVFIASSVAPVTLDDCEKVHLAIDPILDVLNPTDDKPYVLNVSSPGLDRPFKTKRDFERNYSKEVELKLFAPFRGKKVYEGVLKEKQDHAVIIEVNGEKMVFQDNKIVYTRPLVKFT